MSSRPGWDMTQIKNSVWETRNKTHIEIQPSDRLTAAGGAQPACNYFFIVIFPFIPLKYPVNWILNADARDSSSTQRRWSLEPSPTLTNPNPNILMAAGPPTQLRGAFGQNHSNLGTKIEN